MTIWDGSADTVKKRHRARARALHAREEAVGARELLNLSREATITTREKAVHIREMSANAESLKQEDFFVALREANEKLLQACLTTQDQAEAVARDKTKAETAARCAEDGARELLRVAEFRDRLMGVVGHDLRNPLSAIAMGTHMMLNGELDQRVTRITVRIQNSARRMSEIINAVLDLTAAHLGGGIPIKRVTTDLEDLCRDIVEELELGHEGPADFRAQFTGNMQGLWDAGRLGQVISNLAGNALQHTEPGTVITIFGTDEGEFVSLSIHNLGAAIPADILPFLFEPFRQGQNKVSGHLGLGLYITKQIVDAHGGTIEVRSTVEEGTTFAMRLPRSLAGEATLVI